MQSVHISMQHHSCVQAGATEPYAARQGVTGCNLAVRRLHIHTRSLPSLRPSLQAPEGAVITDEMLERVGDLQMVETVALLSGNADNGFK